MYAYVCAYIFVYIQSGPASLSEVGLAAPEAPAGGLSKRSLDVSSHCSYV